jgi:hypothetical protein
MIQLKQFPCFSTVYFMEIFGEKWILLLLYIPLANWRFFPISVYPTLLNFNQKIRLHQSHDSSVCIALGYGLDDRGSRVRFPAGARNFSLHHRVQNGSGAYQASYPMGNRGSFLGGKAAGA